MERRVNLSALATNLWSFIIAYQTDAYDNYDLSDDESIAIHDILQATKELEEQRKHIYELIDTNNAI